MALIDWTATRDEIYTKFRGLGIPLRTLFEHNGNKKKVTIHSIKDPKTTTGPYFNGTPKPGQIYMDHFFKEDSTPLVSLLNSIRMP